MIDSISFNSRYLLIPFFLFSLFFSTEIYSQEQKTFASLDEVLNFAKKNSYLSKNAVIQTKIAAITKKTAISNVINPRFPLLFQAINNVTQPLSFFPAEFFGGPPGTFRQLNTGQQFNSTLNIQPQFDILNLGAVALIKNAKINEEIILNESKINEYTLFEKLNTTYFNILSFEGQKEVLKENIALAQKILFITNNRYKEGIARKQEVNEAESNLISVENNLSQLEINLTQQFLILSYLIENESPIDITEKIWVYEKEIETQNQPTNKLQEETAALQLKFGLQESRISFLENFPVISFISSFNWQNGSNEYFFNKNSQWINNNYIGLRLYWDMPTTVIKLSNALKKSIQTNILKNNAENAKLENQLKNKQLVLDYNKSVLSLKNYKKIYLLKKDTFERNQNQYVENILSLDKLLISQNDLLVSKLNLVSLLSSIGFNKNKISINNKF